jgi:hypothetical protein
VDLMRFNKFGFNDLLLGFKWDLSGLNRIYIGYEWDFMEYKGCVKGST